MAELTRDLQDVLPSGPVGMKWAGFLAASIERADQLQHDRWGLTSMSGSLMLRLNVGAIAVMDVSSHQVIVRVLVSSLRNRASLEAADRLRLWPRSKGERVAGVAECRVFVEEEDEALDENEFLGIEQAHLPLLGTAAGTPRNGRTKDGHSNKAVVALSAFVGRPLPQPKYATTSK